MDNCGLIPEAAISFAGQTGNYVAHKADGEEYEKYWQSALEIHKGYSLYQERAGGRHIPIMVMASVEIQNVGTQRRR